MSGAMSGWAPVIVWTHALAALLFGGVALARLRAGRRDRVPAVAALALTALWALALAGIGSRDLVVRLVEPLRDLAWLVVMFALARRDRAPGLAVGAAYGVVGVVCIATIAVSILAGESGALSTALLLQMMSAVAGLVLAHHLAAMLPAARGGLRLTVMALGAMWAADLLVAATAFAAAGWPHGLVAARGFVMLLVGLAMLVAQHRDGDWMLRPSRTVALRSLSLAVIGLYVGGMVLASLFFASVGGHYTRLFQTAFVAGATATLVGTLASPWLRAWAKVKVAKHLFGHRYDYRHEWLRFTATLGRSGTDAAPLEQRVVQALADLTDSPGGLLLIATGEGLEPAGAWNWSGEGGAAASALSDHLARTDRILDLDALRGEGGSERALLPAWLDGHGEAWALVPLAHMGSLTGAVVLARPPIARALDWEDFDLLRVAGRQVASYLAEGRAVAALGEAQRFDEFNRRFAFIVHDVKNLVSQLALVARNAERHADNPAFRADMIATLKDSCDRMSALLRRLSQHGGGRADPPRAVDVTALVRRLADGRRRLHPVRVTGAAAHALVDPVRFERILDHLVQNAVEAGGTDAPIVLEVSAGSGTVTVAVVDAGCGMTPAFVRDQLFRPFASSKDGGFGIGAFEARQLAEAMGGTVAVDSQPGRGTRIAVTFPAAAALEIAA